MVLTLGKKLITVMLLIMGTWISQAMSRTFIEASLAERHEQWMTQYGRDYASNAKKKRRYRIFKENAKFIDKFNNEGNHTYKLSVNEFADLTNEEFLASHTGYKIITNPISPKPTKHGYRNLTKIPKSMDWRKNGAVTSIKYQGQCGNCWAFSAVAAVEGIIKIKTGNLISLSEQQLVNCAVEANRGCSGAWMDNAFSYIIQNHGLAIEENYPYQAMDGSCDQEKASNYAAKISAFQDVPSNNEEALLQAVVIQPVSISLDAHSLTFQQYSSGVYSGKCGTELNHAVTAIGYGTTDDGTKYWLVKNSWGTHWGEDGYMKILRGTGTPEGLYGINMKAFYLVV